MDFFQHDTKSALESISYAQWIAHAPIVFQAARVMRVTGILQAIDEAVPEGITEEEISKKVNLPAYGLRVLLESGLGSGLVLIHEGRYTLSYTGYFILHDKMTKVNMDFVHDVCYQGMFSLEESIKNSKPEGLKVFGNWKTVYEALSSLPAGIQRSWFAYDHFYSDDAFPKVLPMVFKYKPGKLLDIGGNTGKWALACCKYDADVQVTIADLPGQLAMAKKNIGQQELLHRVTFVETDLLDKNRTLPGRYDAIWMSQFLDCFSEEEIIAILKRCHEALEPEGHVFILEPLWDKQRFEAAAFSLQQSSLYFTAIANGNSRFYRTDDFVRLIDAAGFKITEQTDQIGICQTLLVCRKKEVNS